MAGTSSSITLIEQLGNLKPTLALQDNQGARQDALRLSKRLVKELGQPPNVAVDLAYSPLITVAARVAINLRLFELIASATGPVTSTQLASESGGEELLIIRILRPLSSVGIVNEVGERQWTATPVTDAMASEEIAAGHRMIGEMIVNAAQKAPKYLKEYGHRCPANPQDGLVQFAFQTKMTTFELLSSMPDILRDFNLFMGNTMGSRSYWVDWYPVQDRLLTGLHGQSAVLVDVGAGKGHDLMAFHEKYAGHGRLVLQDLAAVTDHVKDLSREIEIMTHDFFTEQPVTGARAYLYHHILHDWSDEKCLEILGKLRGAMLPGYSKLLIHEMIIPERGASTFHAMLDMAMMAFNAGMERTEEQWRELLGRAGFEVVKVWLPAQEDADGIVEAMINA
ncbi:sterigmatocystin 8-O-methyltransferase [Metarhizium guizhouense ARSEF 977]|uniref:Sterigmatocystin 8-O-methyltransferase n=1 Tax=Metarhizium guizhouense (strain ARSEF 977) TaxID=1276136 RepID=A0A0B4IB99_METGA|nr:sterigmatocystin 8-O-methyltransferase [Metarhizium guizhouense ARSEF 977]